MLIVFVPLLAVTRGEMPPRAARPLSRSQLAFESLLEREDDGQDPVQLPPRGQRNPKKKKEGGRGGGGRDVVVVLDERELAERRASASSAAAAAKKPAAPSGFDELRSRFPDAPRDLLSDVLGSSFGGSVEAAAEALRSLGLGGEEEEEKEKHHGAADAAASEGAREEERASPPVPRTPAMLTEGLWGGLPPDVQRLVYARLGPRDAARAALSCREFAARARAARRGPREVEAAPRASLRAIEGTVAAFPGASSVSLARWRAHLDAFEAGGAAEAAAEAASAAAQQGRHWQRRRWQRSSSSSSSASALPPQLQVADPEEVLEAIEGALRAVARGSKRRAALNVEPSSSSPSAGASEENGAFDPFYLPTLDDAAPRSSGAAAAEVEHLALPRLSRDGGGGCSLPLGHCERLARSVRDVLTGLRSVRFDDVGAGDGPRGLCRGLRRAGDLPPVPGSGDGGEGGGGGGGAPCCCPLQSVAVTGALSLDEESVRALLRSWSSAAPVQEEGRPPPPRPLLAAFDFSRCPLLTFAGTFAPRPGAPLRDGTVLPSVRRVTLDGCDGLERFDLGGGALPALERLSLRNCRRLAEISVVVSPPPLVFRGLVELKVSGCAALRSIAASAALPRLERLSAAGCSNLVELPSRAPTALLEANFFGCRSLPSSALERFLGTAEAAAAAAGGGGEGGGGAAAAPPASRLASLTVNGCVSLSRVRVASPALSSLDAAGCRSCAEVELRGCSAESLRSLRLDGCRELRRLSLPPGGRGHVAAAGGGLFGGGVASSAFLDPATTSASGVSDEVAALVAAATAKEANKEKK